MNRKAKLGSLRESPLGSAVETTLRLAKQNPFPVMLIAAGVGWLVYEAGKERARGYSLRKRMNRAEAVPILNTGHARIYDPDASPLHPMQNSLESRREMSARV
jgi:hypothetical protein